ncbi:MAG: hypothetical protein JW966_01665 [Anaerolineae bacterium]|nr:hypothetical protein [Anaerolineae bacterium]
MTIRLRHIMVGITLGAVLLAACGNKATPIPVFVTPTPLETTAPGVTQSPAAPGSVPPVGSDAPVSGDTAVLPEAQAASPQAEVTQTPAEAYGALTGPDYTPAPLHTAVPSRVSVRPCPAIIRADEVTLYAEPNTASEVVGTALARQKLTVLELAGDSWARTGDGWLVLVDQENELAELDNMWSCEVLRGSTSPATLFGLHLVNGTSREPVFDLAQRLADSGHPLGTVKGLNGTEDLLADLKTISPDTITVYRSVITTQGMLDCPADILDLPDPVMAARAWMDSLTPFWDGVEADYFEYMNECHAPMDWIAEFSIEMMRLANEQDRCLLLFSFPVGNPDIHVFEQLLPAYRYALENPCQPGRTHGIALHAFSTTNFQLVSETDVWIGFRHRILDEVLQTHLPEAVNLPVFVTELGQGNGMVPLETLTCDDITRDVLQYTYQLEEDPYVKGFHWWSIGTGTQWADATACLDQIGTALIAYYNNN